MELSAGKLWSLRRLSDARGFFKMTAVDQRPGVEQLVMTRRGAAAPDYADVGALKRLLIEELSPHSTAMLLDPGYAYPFAATSIDPRKGLLVTLEQWTCEETPGGRKTLVYPGWSVEKIKRLGADGVKLMLWYRPDASAEVLAHQQALVEQVGAECRRHDIAFLLEPLVYPLGGDADSYAEAAGKRPEMVIETVEEFRKERYGIDIFKLETPIAADGIEDPDAGTPAARETQGWYDRIDGLLDRPWVMLSAGAGMEPFRRILTYAFRAGASGYLAGRAIWWPAAQSFPDWDEFRRRIREEGVPYVAAVQSVLEAHGKPWFEKPAFRDGVRLAQAGPRFYADYPGTAQG